MARKGRQREEEPEEDLATIKERLQAVLDQVIQDARQAVVLGQINRLPSTEPRVYKRFNKTHAGRIFTFMRTETLHLQLLALTRLWDQGDRAMSIPRAVGWLRREDVLDDIVARRRAAFERRADEPNFSDANGYTEEDRAVLRANDRVEADRAEAEARAEAERLCREAQAYLEGPLHMSLKVRRHRVIAHSLEITDQEIRAQRRGQVIDPIRVGDEEDILAITLPLVVDINRLARDLHVGFDNIRDIWGVYAEDYWLRFSGRPKKRRRLADLPPITREDGDGAA
ncbi:hypothetical protein [Azospirillum argentinense]|uniref:hypothetical protein n=1 Tax=Azospirillum argentinense TaxID=2970906 RepID=UPI0032DF4A48